MPTIPARHMPNGSAGGRLTGSDMITELIAELDASGEAAAGFEGEMQRLAGYSRFASTQLVSLQLIDMHALPDKVKRWRQALAIARVWSTGQWRRHCDVFVRRVAGALWSSYAKRAWLAWLLQRQHACYRMHMQL